MGGRQSVGRQRGGAGKLRVCQGWGDHPLEVLPQLLQRGILLGGLGGRGDEVPRLLTGAPAPAALLDVAALLPLCASDDARVSTTGAPGGLLRKGHEFDKRSTVQWDVIAEAGAGQAGCSSGVENTNECHTNVDSPMRPRIAVPWNRALSTVFFGECRRIVIH